MKILKTYITLAGLGLGIGTVHAGINLQVTVENLASDGGLYFTPVWTGFHDGSFDIFDAGSPASAGLEALAEDGNNSILSADFGSANGRLELVVNDPGGPGPGLFAPGSSASAQLMVDEVANRYFSYASMLLPSNDAFFANASGLDVELFDAMGNFNGTQTIMIFGVDVWDAGTEVNDTMGAPFSAIGGTSSDEGGLVALHTGLDNFIGTQLGNGDTLDSAFMGATPIAQITVTQVPEPSTYAAMFGALALASVCYIKRRK